MLKVVPEKIEFEDPKNFKVRRNLALRFIKLGTLFFLIGVWCFFGLWPVTIETEYMAIACWLMGILGGIFFLLGLTKLPKVKYPPSDVIR